MVQKGIQLRYEIATAAKKHRVSARCAQAKSKKHRTRAAETTSKGTPQPLVIGDFCSPIETVGTNKRNYKVARLNSRQKQKLWIKSHRETHMYNSAFKEACTMSKESRDARSAAKCAADMTPNAKSVVPKVVSPDYFLNKVGKEF